MVSSADRKNRSFSPLVFSRMGACHVSVSSQGRTIDEDVVPLAAREGSTSLRSSRSRQTRAWRHRVHLRTSRLRSQDDSSRLRRSRRSARCAAGTLPKKRGGRKPRIDSDHQLKANFQKVLEVHTAGNPMKPGTLWTNLSVSAIVDRLPELGTPADRSVVEQLLDHFHLGRRQALKTTAMGPTPDRNQQFEIIRFYKDLYLDSLNPILSI